MELVSVIKHVGNARNQYNKIIKKLSEFEQSDIEWFIWRISVKKLDFEKTEATVKIFDTVNDFW